jgi:hypothetical protein
VNDKQHLEKAILKNNDLAITVLAEVQERWDEFGNEFPFFSLLTNYST